MKSYLSVDLDFWSEHENTKSAIRFFRKVKLLEVPVTFFIEHDEMVEDAKKVRDLTTLYNVDYHSDIVAHKERETLADYNWANFIPGSEKADYVWVLPKHSCNQHHTGLCHADGIDPFDEQEKSGWKSCTITTMSKIDWRNIVRVGVCISPIYVNIKTVSPIFKSFGIDKKKVKKLVDDQPSHPDQRTRGIIQSYAA